MLFFTLVFTLTLLFDFTQNNPQVVPVLAVTLPLFALFLISSEIMRVSGADSMFPENPPTMSFPLILPLFVEFETIIVMLTLLKMDPVNPPAPEPLKMAMSLLMEFEIVMVMLVLLEMNPTNPPTQLPLLATLPLLIELEVVMAVLLFSMTDPTKPPMLLDCPVAKPLLMVFEMVVSVNMFFIKRPNKPADRSPTPRNSATVGEIENVHVDDCVVDEPYKPSNILFIPIDIAVVCRIGNGEGDVGIAGSRPNKPTNIGSCSCDVCFIDTVFKRDHSWLFQAFNISDETTKFLISSDSSLVCGVSYDQ